ncbi:hypothetical protein EZV62_013281 [Acer yangbiense]|uniref:Prolamin-like domain-containing protein n=1 Tax=Acer yangbiense TaxID=1000413 RepID=A0A5C7HYQ7_9ROSI|nr:hypothetical protein EZV62_013281 [Acer yangbiense]
MLQNTAGSNRIGTTAIWIDSRAITNPIGLIPGLLPMPPVPELQKCWAALTSAPGCVMEIYSSLLSGQIGKIGPVCCAAITQEFCAAPSPNAVNKISLPGLLRQLTRQKLQNAGHLLKMYKASLQRSILKKPDADSLPVIGTIKRIELDEQFL